MNFRLKFRNLKNNEEISRYIKRRFSFAFARTRHAIEKTTITLSDINGPKGGVDKCCQVVIKPVGLQPIIISEKKESLLLAADKALQKASQSLKRKIKRKQALSKKQRSVPLLQDLTPAT